MNNELVRVDNGQVVVNSRQIAENFEKEHKVVLRNIQTLLAEQNCAAKFFIESTFNNRGKRYPQYLMNRDGFTLLAMGFTGTRAIQWKIRYIEAFNEMEKKLKIPQLPDFTNPVIAARAWADEVEAKQIAEAKVVELTPKAEYFDGLVKHNLLTTIRVTAKELQYPERKFVTFLADKGYIYRDAKGKLQPYAKYVPSLFQIKEYHSKHNGHVGTHILLTPEAKETFRLLTR